MEQDEERDEKLKISKTGGNGKGTEKNRKEELLREPNTTSAKCKTVKK